MSQLGVTPEDIATALRDQNAQFAAGRMGAEPMSSGVGVTWQITTQGRLTTPEQFGDVILRTQPDGSILRLKDVATIELGAQSYDFVGKYNGLDAVPIGIYLSPARTPLPPPKWSRPRWRNCPKSSLWAWLTASPTIPRPS